MNNNYMNFTQEELNKPLFRVISCDRFIQMLTTKTNGLVRPKMWDDPFENFVLNGIAVASDGTKAQFGFRDDLYGQCWSFHIETDAMWRIYSPDKKGVKIKTTIAALHTSLHSQAGQYKDISCFIGKVRYLTQKGIKAALQSVTPLDSSGKGIAETLLIKRKAFSPEREIRLVYINQDKSFKGDVYAYPINPAALFSEAVLDPRMADSDVNVWKQQFKQAGFSNKIIQSGLYKPPKNIFVHI